MKQGIRLDEETEEEIVRHYFETHGENRPPQERRQKRKLDDEPKHIIGLPIWAFVLMICLSLTALGFLGYNIYLHWVAVLQVTLVVGGLVVVFLIVRHDAREDRDDRRRRG